MADDGMVFIVGLPRSGTSIIYRTIQKLPNFKSGRLNLWETNIFRERLRFNQGDQNHSSLLGYLHNRKDIYSLFLKSIKKYTYRLSQITEKPYRINIHTNYGVLCSINEILRNKLIELRWNRSYRRKIIQQYFNIAKKYRNTKRITEKTPHHYLHVHQILWTFPEAYVIWVIRHPIDIFTSSVKRSKIDKNFQHIWTIDSFVKDFKHSFQRYNFYKKKFKNHLTMVKYEDFVENPAHELKKICDSIREPFCSDSLIIQKKEAFKWEPDPHLSSNIVSNTEKNWEDHLSIPLARKIESSLSTIMKTYNFDFYTKEFK